MVLLVEIINKESYLKILKKTPPFNLLKEIDLKLVMDSIVSKTYSAETYIFRQGDKSVGSLFIVESGLTEVTVTSDHGIEKITGYRKKYDFFGETVFLSEEEYPGSAKALKETTCFLVNSSTIEKLLEKNPDFARYFSKVLASRIKSLYHSFILEDPFQGGIPIEPPLRKRIESVMSAPPATCRLSDSIQNIAKYMQKKHVSSVIVLDDNNNPTGIITEKDLVTKVITNNLNPNTIYAKDIINSSFFTISQESFLYQALLIMVKNNVKHIIVLQEEKLVGIVTMRDLVKSRSTGALTIVNSIESNDNIDGLMKAVKEIDKVFDALISEKASALEICELITEFYDRLTRKIIKISELELIEEGFGPPPTNYSWINMGSSGRKEQFVKTDQDNGIIYEDVAKEKDEEVKKYFLLLGEKVVEGLYRCGFEKCKGEVMANNEKWSHSFKKWREITLNWISEPNPDNVRLMTIFLDFRHIYGKKSLCDLLKNYVTRNYQKNHVALQYLAKDDLQHRAPLGFFKQIITEKNKDHKNMVNLKSSACVHIVDCLRVLSLREGIIQTPTFIRLKELTARNVFSFDDSEMLETAYETLMIFRIRENIKKIKKGQHPDNYINPNLLSKRERTLLRESFLTVDRLQNLISYAFHVHTM